MRAAYAYLLRNPLLGGLLLAALAPLALWDGSPLAPLLRGTFDVDATSVIVITLFTGLMVTALVLSTEMVVRYGDRRFQVPSPSPWLVKPVYTRGAIVVTRASLVAILLYNAAAAVLLLGLVFFARPSWPKTVAAIIVGLAAVVVIVGSVLIVWSRLSAASARLIATVLLWTPDGYLEELDPERLKHARGSGQKPQLLPGHGLLTLMTAATFVVYVLFGSSKYVAIRRGIGVAANPLTLPSIPTLACIIVLLTLGVYVLSGLAFLLDRFRVPIALPILAIAVASSDWPQSDAYFDVTAAPGVRLAVTPAQALASRGPTAIVVTASGGGIHAAAWTASVLAQLEQEFGSQVHESIRLFSSVSGGSVGTMYIVNAIEQGTFTSSTALASAFEPASTSSLDDIAWGLVYPDLTRVFAPFLVGLDRGKAAELAWQRLAPPLGRPFSAWRAGAASGTLPAVLFNTTLADTGGRLVIGTTDLAPKRGLQTFSNLYDEEDPSPETIDPSIVTAARLSASFTYVTPASRIDRPVKRSRAYHVVDGGYFDNFGVATAVDWLDTATRDGSRIANVLVVQIRGPVALQDPTAKPGRGLLQQIAAPISTLVNFRDAAQLAHNNQELSLLCQTLASRHIALETAVFQYPKCTAPLSWHLTPAERDSVWNEYANTNLARARGRVRSFLSGEFAQPGSCGVFQELPPVVVDPTCR